MGWETLRVKDVLDHLPLAALVTRDDGRVMYANPACLRLLARPRLARATSTLGDWRVADARLAEAQRRALARGPAWQGEARWHTGGGRTLAVWESVHRLPTGAGVLDVHVLEDLAVMKRLRRLAALAFYDALTGLPNRNLLADRIRTAVERARRSGRPFALFYLDLDGMKRVNDSAGHAAGDRLLFAVARAVRRAVRRRDTVARLAGDEFVVIAEDLASRGAAAQVAARVLGACRAAGLSVSVGISFYPEHGRSMPALLARADAALYRAKARGRDRYAFADKPPAPRAAARAQS